MMRRSIPGIILPLLDILRLSVWRFALVCATTALVSAAWPATALRDSAAAHERSVKAEFLHKFVAYVEWPKGTFADDTAITIAVAGDDEFADELARLVSQLNVEGKLLTVIKQKDDELSPGTHILFVTRAETAARLRKIVKSSNAILIVTEAEDALSEGSAINFVVIDGRVRFEISLDAADKRGLKISSRLLAVAHSVRPVAP